MGSRNGASRSRSTIFKSWNRSRGNDTEIRTLGKEFNITRIVTLILTKIKLFILADIIIIPKSNFDQFLSLWQVFIVL